MVSALKSLFCLLRYAFSFAVTLTDLNADSSSDDQDFPPLGAPTKLREALPTPKSRIHSVQGSLNSPVRSSTPQIPPGLNLPHAHPSPSFAEIIETKRKETKSFSNISGPVTPALPILPIGPRPVSPRGKAIGTLVSAKPEEDSEDVVFPSFDDISNGAEEKVAVDTTDIATIPADAKPLLTQAQTSPAEDTFRKSFETESDFDKHSFSHAVAVTPLERLDISAALAQKSRLGESPSKTKQQVLPQGTVETPITIESFANTPNASTNRSPDWTSTSGPRTLRLTTTTTPKAETAPASAMTERSTTLPAAVLKQTSRQPSFSSMSRSRTSTPTVSEHGTSTGISRAGSPPPSDIVGSAPERNKSKSQGKKERKVRSKMTTESKDEESVESAPPVSEEVGPIISRQKKKKRTQEKSDHVSAKESFGVSAKPEPTVTARIEKATKAGNGTGSKDTSSVSSQDRPVVDTSKANPKAGQGKSKVEKKSILATSNERDNRRTLEPTSHRAYTLNDLFNDAAKLPDTENALSELLNASISATSRLLQELSEASDIDLNSSLFNAPTLTSYKLPPQPHKGADYLDANGYTMNSPFGEIYLSGHDRKQLLQGRHVRLSDPNKPHNVLNRNMITPGGAIFRHLSAEEEERVIWLENRMKENEEKYGAAGKSDLKPLDDMDVMNLTGGLQDLIAFPPLHRISLLTSEPGTEDEDGENGSDETEDEMAPLASGFGAAREGPIRKPMSPTTMKRKAEALMTVNLRNLDVDKLQKRIRESQVEMEGARKEMEALEKKVARKAKDVTRWREALLKEVARGP